MEAGLRRERDHVPFSPAGAGALRKLAHALRSGRMEVRRYEEAFLHAKAYILTGPNGSFAAPAGLIAGSSNLTRAGLTTNIELNLARYDHPIIGDAAAWFDALWDEAVPYDLAEVFEAVFADWRPWDIFLRVLYQLYGSELAEEEKEHGALPLTNFQRHGVVRALRLIRDRGGALVADEVGLGKTFIAGDIIQIYRERRQRALLVCPAQLRDSTWRKFLGKYEIYLDYMSYEELANDTQIRTKLGEPGGKEHLPRPLDEYQLVVVDEAHNYRNPDTPTRARVLRTLLYGERRDVLLLSATPVNNSLWDLFHLLRFFMRQDAALADHGILSVRQLFDRAMRQDPSSLSPDLLYPVIDATTVKRTRQFVKRHYSGDTILGPDGQPITIVFPKPVPIAVRYDLDARLPGFFDRIEEALDPDGGGGALEFARYTPDLFLKQDGDAEEEGRAHALVGLLRSGILKRFESSTEAFRNTIAKMVREHGVFLDALSKGHVIATAFLRELDADDEDLDSLLGTSEHVRSASLYDIKQLRAAVERDRDILQSLLDNAEKIPADEDPKLQQLLAELKSIAAEAISEGVDDDDSQQLRKVLVFSFFNDTVRWLYPRVHEAAEIDPALKAFSGRIMVVSGEGGADDVSRQQAIQGFAPISTEAQDRTDRFDILLSTDVLAEGANLQQCRHIINYDMPWNPMRLVQRHGRIDRIGSPHTRVFLRTFFPTDRLDRLLRLEQRILNKLAMAAASVGVAAPVSGAASGKQVFAETRAEIEKLLREDPSLYERGGTAGAAQTGEEYRQTLRKALKEDRDRIETMPWKAGSGMLRGDEAGVFFCAAIGDRTYLRFVRAGPDWLPLPAPDPDDAEAVEPVVREPGTCLRLIECEEDTERRMPPWSSADAVFAFWDVARRDIHAAWMHETDPANLQPRVRPINLRAADFIRAHPPIGMADRDVSLALDIVEAPWPRREEVMLRGWLEDDELEGAEKAAALVQRILDSGLEPFRQPPLLPPISEDDIDLICWMALSAA